MSAKSSTDVSAEPAQEIKQLETDEELKTYQQAVQEGQYTRDTGGLSGKHDNVRRYWENELTGQLMRDPLESFVIQKKRALERLRVVDLGCGSGEGYELLTSIRRRTSGVETTNSLLIGPELIGLYLGVDISQAMVEQGRTTYGADGKIVFEPADLREGLPAVIGDEPFDLYFSSYGSLSHLNDEELEDLLTQIAEHAGGHALLVLDLLGKYSYEWQDEWDSETPDGMRDYSMAYLYPEGGVEEADIEHFPMRYWSRGEVEQLLERVSQRSGRKLELRRTFDRSLLVGRHIDTGVYNAQAQPLRRVVNMLHESNHRTDLRDLLFDYRPRPGFPEANRFFERLQMAWNGVVDYCIDRLTSDEMDPEHQNLDLLPEPVQTAAKTMARVIENVRWMRMGDPRANILEPQLAYTLRGIEVELQRGEGYGHAFLALVELSEWR